MKAIIQRVSRASVSVDGKAVGEIGRGFVVLLGVFSGDTEEQAQLLAKKTAGMRIFTDENDKMNLSLDDVGGSVLAISNFTLCADCKKGKRPNFINAERPERAKKLYEYYCKALLDFGVKNVQTGIFGADMLVSIQNDGPVTIDLDAKELI